MLDYILLGVKTPYKELIEKKIYKRKEIIRNIPPLYPFYILKYTKNKKI